MSEIKTAAVAFDYGPLRGLISSVANPHYASTIIPVDKLTHNGYTAPQECDRWLKQQTIFCADDKLVTLFIK